MLVLPFVFKRELYSAANKARPTMHSARGVSTEAGPLALVTILAMSEGPITIRCPYCGYPYPMSKLQLDIYIGRSMGCMHCGKSFAVSAPSAPPSEPRADLGAAGTLSPAEAPGHVSDAPPPIPTRTPATPAVATTSTRLAEPPSSLAILAMMAAFAFMALAATAAVVGYAGSSDNAIKAVSRSQTPLILLRIALVLAAVGAAVGALAMIRDRTSGAQSNRRVRFGIAAPATVICLLELVLASLLSLMVLPGLTRGLSQSHRAACQMNLQSIGYALIATASEQVDGKFPDSLGDLISNGQIPADVFVCPAGPHTPASPTHSKREQADLIARGNHVTYTYLGKGLAMRATDGHRVSTHTVLAYEPRGLHGDDDGFHVLFADGAVVFATKERGSKLLEELQSGQNPPPSAAALKP